MDSAEIVNRMAEAIYDAKGYAGCPKTDTGETRTVWADSQAEARAAYAALVNVYGTPYVDEGEPHGGFPSGMRRLVFPWKAYEA